MKTRTRRGGLWVLLPVLLVAGPTLSASGCRGEGSSGDDPVSFGAPSAGRTVTADGSWAAEFARARAQATSDFERQVLADGVLTETEFLEALSRRNACYADHGHPGQTEYLGFGQYGFRYQSDGLDEAGRKALSEACDVGTVLVIGPLWAGAATNPDNEDFSALVVECLVRAELVPPGYSADRYMADSSEGTLPYLPENPAAVQCEGDPKGLFAGEPSAVSPSVEP